MLQQVVAAAVDGLLSHDVVTSLCQCFDGVGDGSSTGSGSQSSHAAFQSSDALLEHVLRRVGQTAVDVACVCQAEAVCCVLAVAEHIGSGLVNGHCTGIGCGIGLLLSLIHIYISPATRERVRAAAHRMGYLPNAAARSLKTNRTYNLGVLFVDERQSGLTHEYFSAVLDSFKVEAEKHGYDITFINHNISGKSMSYLEHCRYRNVDGVVIACVNFYEPQVVELVNSEVPVVTIDHVFNNRMAILSDNVFGLKALVRQAWACGHRRIAFIHGEKTAVTENRVAGFYQACEELGLKIPEAYVREGIYHDADRCAAETKALLELPQPPTCIIFPDDFSALGGYNAINEAGLLIPEDVSVMGYDGIYLSRVVKPQLVTYQQNTTALGRTAADKLIELIEHPRVTLPEQIRVSGKLLDGWSVSIL